MTPATEAGGIFARDLTVTYRNGHTALRHASFTVPEGSVTALIGPNGAGKSTLFKALMGLLPVSGGEMRLLGLPVAQALARTLVAYVPQAEEVDWTFPVLVEDVVMMGRYGRMGFLRRPRQADREAVEAALTRVGMSDFRHRQIGELSGGQRKRVFLARALAQDGRLILLDEPFTGVDAGTEDRIIALLGELRAEGRVMLVSTHELARVPEFCDRVVIVRGTVLASGPTAETFTPDMLALAFGEPRSETGLLQGTAPRIAPADRYAAEQPLSRGKSAGIATSTETEQQRGAKTSHGEREAGHADRVWRETAPIQPEPRNAEPPSPRKQASSLPLHGQHSDGNGGADHRPPHAGAAGRINTPLLTPERAGEIATCTGRPET